VSKKETILNLLKSGMRGDYREFAAKAGFENHSDASWVLSDLFESAECAAHMRRERVGRTFVYWWVRPAKSRPVTVRKPDDPVVVAKPAQNGSDHPRSGQTEQVTLLPVVEAGVLWETTGNDFHGYPCMQDADGKNGFVLVPASDLSALITDRVTLGKIQEVLTLVGR
jgi:hypothetical protein